MQAGTLEVQPLRAGVRGASLGRVLKTGVTTVVSPRREKDSQEGFLTS